MTRSVSEALRTAGTALARVSRNAKVLHSARGARDACFMPKQRPAVTFSVRLVAGPEVHRELAALVGPTRAQPGCLRCTLLCDAENPAEMELVGEWASRADLDRHLRSEDCRRLLAAIDRAHAPPEFHIYTLARCDGIEAIAAARSGSSHQGDPP